MNMTQHHEFQRQPIRITERNYFVQLAKLLDVRPDWHEPDEQEVTARVSGTKFDNAGFWPHPESYNPPVSVEQHVIFSQCGIDVAVVNLASLCAWASKPDTVAVDTNIIETTETTEMYWRSKIAAEIRVIADNVRQECYTPSAGVALAALVENVADKICNVSPVSSAVSSAVTTDHRPTREEYFNSLTSGDRWAHCGSDQQHDTHAHTIVFNEGPYPSVCVGTPALRISRTHNVPPPPSIDI